MNNRKIYYGAFAALCIVGLAVGLAGAAELTGAARGCTGMHGGMNMHGPGTGPCTSMENKIACLESRGIDVTEVKEAYERGDSASVQAWFMKFSEEHRDWTAAGRGNCTAPCQGA